ncbi:unnamed protein product [Urochloa decumbens]|uniref:PGG domain-containing protein n=1 Tax=Urochloa decumbens TaxID=240449 RepID=A0ABC9FWB7_9POAL
MAEALAAPVEFGPEKMTLSTELLKALTAGDVVRLEQLMSGEGRPQADGHVAINVVNGGVASPPRAGASCLLGVTCNGNTALHLAASRGHAKLSELLCEKAPSLVATRNRGLDTPLHCAAKAGHREVVACLLSAMRSGGEETVAALRARNCLGATALYEAVRYRHAGLVDLLMTEAPELSSFTTEDGFSPLYLAASIDSLEMVKAIVRPALDGTPSPASYSGPEGRTALHAATVATRGITNKDGHTARDLALRGLVPGRLYYPMDPLWIVHHFLHWSGASVAADPPVLVDNVVPTDSEEETSNEDFYDTKGGTIGSVLIATVAFAAAFTVPGGFIADDRPSAGTAILAKRFAFRVFVVSDTMAFVCSVVATSFLIFGGTREIPRNRRLMYSSMAPGWVSMGAVSMITAFAFGFDLVLGKANRGLIVFVYLACLFTVACSSSVWVATDLVGLVMAVQRRTGWRGLFNIHRRPWNLMHSPVAMYLHWPLLLLLIAATFVVAIALNIALPNY